MFFGLNTEWVPNANDSRFRCPSCGQQYRPGKTSSNYIDAQHVWILQSPGAPAYYMLAVWPETAEENWISQQMESEACGHRWAVPYVLCVCLRGHCVLGGC